MHVSLDRVLEEGEDDSPEDRLQSMRAAQALQDNRVRINVGGIRHETYKSTLRNIPDTRLAWLTTVTVTNTTADYDPINREFFFDRHPTMFEAVLNYYRTGKLHAPSNVCGPAFEEELQFWGIDEKQIEACCWSHYTEHRDAQETIAKLQGPGFEQSDSESEEDVAKIFGIEEVYETERNHWYRKWQPRIWTLLEEPYSSRAALLTATISFTFVMLSIMSFCMETAEPFIVTSNTTMGQISEPVLTLFVIEGVCVAFFTVELAVRFAFCPNKTKFFLEVLNLIDIVACIPFYVDAVVKLAKTHLTGTVNEFLGFLRIVRIFRIFKLARHLSGLQILMHTLRASAKELVLLIVFLGLGVLVSSSLVYYAERWVNAEDQRNDFPNIPIGFWWAVVTMTTVGYGDLVPRTWLGMIVGAVTAIIGVLTLALPVPVIVNNFALFYTHAQARAKLPKKRKRVLVGAADALKTQGANMSSSISGYSTQSTTEEDDTSIRSDDLPVKTVSGSLLSSEKRETPTHLFTAASARGEKTNISVTFTDEAAETFSPKRCKSPASSPTATAGETEGSKPRRMVKRMSLVPQMRRESFAPNVFSRSGMEE
ncbi:potassium voltage-gated channel protein Shaw-like [Diadema setosum]|uniref:potassium voltage-gated channel protein Shaw-like n=1 Tax=Diadema setosum TaxID=31175 RepID=UPI003B3A141E